VDTSTTAGGDEQQKRVADDEGRDEESDEGEGNGDEGGGRAKATMVKKRARGARVMVTRVVGDEEGNMVRNNDDGLVPFVVQQAVLHLASASLDDVGDDESTGRRLGCTLRTDNVGDDRTMTTMTATSSCRPLA